MVKQNADPLRRCDVLKNTPEELRIREAVRGVEALGAHPLLTQVSSLLEDARERLADWVDQGRPGHS